VPESSFWWLLTQADRDELAAAGRRHTYRDADVLCNEGDPTTQVFVLLSGWVKISTVSSEGKRVLQAVHPVVHEVVDHVIAAEQNPRMLLKPWHPVRDGKWRGACIAGARVRGHAVRLPGAIPRKRAARSVTLL